MYDCLTENKEVIDASLSLSYSFLCGYAYASLLPYIVPL